MQKLIVKRFRLGLLVFSGWIVFVLMAPLPGEANSVHWPLIPVLVFLAFMLFKFRIVETVTFEDGKLAFTLQNIDVQIPADEIVDVQSFDCWNKVKVSTSTLHFVLNVRRFSSRAMEKFFIENGLGRSESLEG